MEPPGALRGWMRRVARHALLAFGVAGLVAALGLATTPAEAGPATQRLPAKNFSYKANGIAVTDLLRDFGGAIEVPVVLADGIAGTANATFNLQPEQFLQVMSKAYGLIWYFDGTALYVYPSSQIQTRLISVPEASAESMEGRLRAMGVYDPRYPVRYEKGRRLMLVSGPPRYLELVEGIAGAVGEEKSAAQPLVTRTFALKHAFAADRVAQGAVVQGVASKLAAAFGAGSARPGPEAGNDTGLSMSRATEAIIGSPAQREKAFESVRGAGRKLGYSNPEQNSLATVEPEAAGRAAGNGRQAPLYRPRNPASFVADEATNSVIARLRADDMESVEALVTALDVPAGQIEFAATIIEISSSDTDALGVQWNYDSSRNSVAAGTGPGAGSSPASLIISTILRNNGSELLARVRALQAKGSARIVSQPRVIGVANRTAVLSEQQSAYVRVAGNQDASLFAVQTGMLMQITPRILSKDDSALITMALVIEDGSFSPQNVDGIPIVTKTTINTEATLVEGQTLLIGGIAVEGSSNDRSAVPGLSKLPGLGFLFRSDESKRYTRQRLFMISPRRINVEGLQAAARAAETAP